MSETGPTPEPPRTGPAGEPSDPAEPASGPAQKASLGGRTSGLWTAVVALIVLLVLLAIFVFQNTQEVRVTYFGWEVDAPLSAALLVATAAGGLIAVAAGSLRILQLRRRVRHETKLRRTSPDR